MILHTVTFTWKEGASLDQIAALTAAVEAMGPALDGLISLHFGPDLAFRSGNGDYILSAMFRDESAWRAYQLNPVHKTLVSDFVGPLLGSRIATQIAV